MSRLALACALTSAFAVLTACTPEPGGGGSDPPAPTKPSGSGGSTGGNNGRGGSTGSGGSTSTPTPEPTPPKPDAAAEPTPSPDPTPTPDGGKPSEDAAAPTADTAPADAPSAGDAGTVIVPGVRTSLNGDIMSKWTGVRKSITQESGGPVFTGVFEANKFGGPQGHNIRLPLPPAKEYIFEYKIRFDGNFPFTRGGKIPGLAGGNAPTGCVDTNAKGFSARMMWRQGAQLVGYIYDQDQSSDCGNNVTTSFNFKAGQWHSIKERVRVNTGGNRDGILQIWADDKMLVSRTNMRYMADGDNNNVSVILFHSFFGGSTQAWAPARQCSISFTEAFVTMVTP